VPAVGVKTVAQAKENLASLQWTMTKAEEEALDSAVKKMKKTTLQNVFQTP
jgi:aryl-alcohol dehydrogenase-like predicted oxidoreductase